MVRLNEATVKINPRFNGCSQVKIVKPIFRISMYYPELMSYYVSINSRFIVKYSIIPVNVRTTAFSQSVYI